MPWCYVCYALFAYLLLNPHPPTIPDTPLTPPLFFTPPLRPPPPTKNVAKKKIYKTNIPHPYSVGWTLTARIYIWKFLWFTLLTSMWSPTCMCWHFLPRAANVICVLVIGHLNDTFSRPPAARTVFWTENGTYVWFIGLHQITFDTSWHLESNLLATETFWSKGTGVRPDAYFQQRIMLATYCFGNFIHYYNCW